MKDGRCPMGHGHPLWQEGDAGRALPEKAPPCGCMPAAKGGRLGCDAPG